MNNFKEEYNLAKSKLFETKKTTRAEFNSFKKEQKEFKKSEIEKLKQLNLNQEQFESKVRELNFNFELKKTEWIVKIKEIADQILKLKNDYADKINTIWQTKNIENLNSKEPIYISKKDELQNKIENKKSSFFEKHNQKLVKVDDQISKLRIQQNELETDLVQKIENTNNEWDKQFYVETIGFEVIKIKKRIRVLKSKRREILDNNEIKVINFNTKQDNKFNKFVEKRERKFKFDKPFTKKWFSGQILNDLNIGVAKLDRQRHLYAIKMGLIYLMPITLVSAFWILTLNVILSTGEGGFLRLFGMQSETQGLTNFKSIGVLIQNITLGLMGLVIAGTIASVLGDRYKLGKISSSVVGMTCFMSLIPILTFDAGDGIKNYLNFADLGSSSMFLGIFAALLSIEVYNVLTKAKWLKIKMPNGIPPAVAKSFNVVIPYLLVTFIFAASSWSLTHFTDKNLNDLIAVVIQKPLSGSIESIWGVIIIRLICDGLWVVGIHGTNMIGPVVSPIYVDHLAQNMEAVNNGLRPEYIVTSTFFDSYVLCSMAMIPLITIFIFSRRKDYIAIFSVAIIPSLFNISEPAIFGLPILLNPILAIPLILASLSMAIVGYFLTLWGFAMPLYVMTPWTTPPIIGPFIASGGDVNCLLLAIGLIALGMAVYTPFVLLANKQANEYNPELIVSRFNKKTRRLTINKEIEEHLKLLKEKNRN